MSHISEYAILNRACTPSALTSVGLYDSISERSVLLTEFHRVLLFVQSFNAALHSLQLAVIKIDQISPLLGLFRHSVYVSTFDERC